MPRTAARITQADVARCIRAARQAGAAAVEVHADGTILVLIEPLASCRAISPKIEVEPDEDIIL